ncbi:aspartyl-phosphate phosphatase Spo0E family protein [Neobacillus sp. 114]|uniref:aspartyl-phosphate phosphatase Spo0E family protein n=1 Tax=Neobacillus sp. 114 TaxID=3048535 RepID=UPI0024C3FF7E|nr:aspartyl-phosphate phosphatase Spo0E family protein [Neobacillus sp. 114]
MTYLILMIENKRRELQELTDKYGKASKIPIECSQELDTLLNLLFSIVEKED